MVNEQMLCAEYIDKISEEIVASLNEHHVNSKDITLVRLSTEEFLSKYFEEFGENVPISFKCEKRFSEIRIVVSLQCGRMNPFLDDDDEFGLLNKLLRGLTVAPVWNYRGNRNVITFSIKKQKKIPDFMFYIFAAVLGIVGGLLAKNLPNGVLHDISDSFLNPVSDVVMGLLNSLAVIMVFTSVVSGICGMCDINTFKKIGMRMLRRFTVILVGCTVFVTAVSLLFFPISRNGSGSFDAFSLWQMVVNIVPTNVFSAFSSGNVLQIIFISILCGVVMLVISPKITYLSEWIDNANQIVQKMLEIVVKPMPIIVFINIFKIVSLESISNYSGIFKYMIIMIICCIAMTLFSVLRVCIRQKLSPGILIKKLIPTYLIALSTASSAAAYTTNIETCKKSLGIDQSIYRIGIPLGQIIFKPCTVFQPVCGCLCFAALYGINISLAQLFTLLFTVLILAIAEPPVPGVLVCCFTLLFSQIGVPVEALSIILALECILDRLGTCTNLLSLQTELVQLADSMSLLDKTKLHE